MLRERYTILGAYEETPVYRVVADRDGPTVVVVGGLHGNEVTSPEAADLIRCWTVSRGELIVIPRANRPAVEAGTRSATEYGQPDINRQFPTGETPTHGIARGVWRVITSNDADFVFDLHRSKGLCCGRSPNGVGQAVYPTPGGRDVARAAMSHMNSDHIPADVSSTHEFRVGNTQDGSNDLLSHKVGGDLDPSTVGWLVETCHYRQNAYVQRDQLEHAVQTILHHATDGAMEVLEYGHNEHVPKDSVLAEYGEATEDGGSTDDTDDTDDTTDTDDTDDTTDTDDTDDTTDTDGDSEEPTRTPAPIGELGETIDVREYGFTGDTGDCLGEFVADRADEERAFLLPDGTYRWTRICRFTNGSGAYDEPVPERFALVGAPQATIHVDIDSDEPKERSMFRFGGRSAPVPEVELRNLHVDVGDADPDRDAGICRANVRDRMVAENLSMSKRCRLNADGSRNGDRFSYKVDITDEDGVGTHRNIDLTAGDVHREDQNDVGHAIPFASEPNHEGLNKWDGCRVAGYTDNGFYVRNYSETGRNILDGCLARNCGGGNIRLGRNDQARGCRIVVDGAETPANGAGLWIENARGTTVSGLEIYAPALDNDAIRVTGALSSGSIRDADVHQGDREYAIKATASDCEAFTFDDITVHDRGDGEVRVASILCTMDNATFRDVTVLNRDHHGRGGNGRAGLCLAATDVGFDGCRFETDNPHTVILGSPWDAGAAISARFDACTFVKRGAGSALMRYENDPRCGQLIVKNGTIGNYNQLIGNGSIYKFDTVSVRDNHGYEDHE